MPHRLLTFILLLLLDSVTQATVEFYVAPDGHDANPGTQTRPFATLDRARLAVAQRTDRAAPVSVLLTGGIYYLPETLVFQAADSGTKEAPIIYAALPGQTPVISGGQKLALAWSPYQNGIHQAPVPAGTTADQLFINGQRQIMARYPDFDANAAQFNGTAADAISPARAARWADPAGGFFHAMHGSLWGDMHYLITGKDAQGGVTYVGGWQNNRQSGPTASSASSKISLRNSMPPTNGSSIPRPIRCTTTRPPT
jgi:hypothetical protein